MNCGNFVKTIPVEKINDDTKNQKKNKKEKK